MIVERAAELQKRAAGVCFCVGGGVGLRATGRGGAVRSRAIAVRMVASVAEKAGVGTALSEIEFKNSFVDELPGDDIEENYVRRVSGAAYSRVAPTPPWEDDQSRALGKKNTSSKDTLKMAGWSSSCAEMLGLDSTEQNSPSALAILAGAEVVPSMKPYAQCYGGHQFGNWAEQLGDGRVINLGEDYAMTPNCKFGPPASSGQAKIAAGDGKSYEIQLKGAGKTPYSRFADGRAVMRSSVREFLCSEAMHHLGVPTTRALSLVATGAGVVRDQFYDGRAKVEPGAVVSRVAENFVRLGSFQLPASRNDHKLLKQIADHTVRRSFPQYLDVSDEFDDDENRYLLLLRDVIERTAKMITHWHTVGFVHGVCNTDNFSVLGLTIDYGPYGFLDEYNPAYTPNTSDMPGRRYCYGRQPTIGLWNLVKFAEALVPLIGVAPAQAELERYKDIFAEELQAKIQKKLGLMTWGKEDDELHSALLENMQTDAVDFTNTWRSLSKISSSLKDETDDGLVLEPLSDVLSKVKSEERRSKWSEWIRRYAARVANDADLEGRTRSDEERASAMDAVNPKYILRNYLAQNAIEKAEEGDFTEITKLLEILQRPFDEQPENEAYTAEPPEWASQPGVCMNSCSS